MMPLARRMPLAAVVALALSGCFGSAGNFPAAQDARMIVAAITPVAQRANSLGAAPGVAADIRQSLATITAEAGVMSRQYQPGYIDTQEFLVAARDLLGALDQIGGLSPGDRDVIDAATALLPTFAAVVGTGSPATTMSVEQARMMLRGADSVAMPTTPVAAPVPPPVAARASPPAASPPAASPPAASPPAASSPAAGRFHVSADDFGGAVGYQFWDNGKVVESGTAPNFAALEARFAAFKTRRLSQAP